MICKDCQTPYHKEFNPPKVDGVCDKCGGQLFIRDDDKPETVKKRLDVFKSSTKPLVDFYSKRGLIVKLPSELSASGAVADMRELSKKLGFI